MTENDVVLELTAEEVEEQILLSVPLERRWLYRVSVVKLPGRVDTGRVACYDRYARQRDEGEQLAP